MEVARAHEPEFVLLDIGLPGMDGYEVASRLRREPCCRDSLIVAVSGYGQDEDRRRSKASGLRRPPGQAHRPRRPARAIEPAGVVTGGTLRDPRPHPLTAPSPTRRREYERDDHRRAEENVTGRENPRLRPKEHQAVRPVADEIAGVGRLSPPPAQGPLPGRQRAGHARHGFEDHHHDHRQVADAEPDVADPLPSQGDPHQDHRHPQYDIGHIRRVKDHDGVRQDSGPGHRFSPTSIRIQDRRGRPVGGAADVDVGDGAGPPGVGRGDGLGEGVGLVGRDEVHRAARPARPRELAAEEARATPRPTRSGRRAPASCCRSRRGWRRARRSSTGRTSPGRRGPARRPRGRPAGSRSGRGGHGAGRPGRARPRPIPGRRASRRGASGRARAARAGLEVGHDGLALGPALVVIAVGQPPRGLRVADDDRRRGVAQRQPGEVQAPAVERQRVPGPAEQDGELVEQARGDPDELVLRALEDPGQVQPRGVVQVGRAVGDDLGAAARTTPAPPGGSPSWKAPRRAGRPPRSPRRRPR